MEESRLRAGRAIREFARRAAFSARTERAARLAALQPVRSYVGVHHRKNRYIAVIWNIHTARLLWLGSYETPEEAAYAYDAAARVTRGHKARPNFPVPAWLRARARAAAPEEVSTELALSLPTPPARQMPAARARAPRDPAAAVAGQASFDNWLSGSPGALQPQHQQGTPPAAVLPHQQQQQPVLLPPFTQFFCLSSDPATAAANGAADAAVANPSIPSAYILTPQNVRMMLSTNPASSALSSTEPIVHASHFLSAAAPTQHRRELPVSQASVFDLSIVADNFPDIDGASSSAAARPPVPRLKLKDLLLQLDLPRRGGSGGAQ